MADLDRVRRNVTKMVGLNAPEEDIDAYITSEGVTLEQIRAHKVGGQQPQFNELETQVKRARDETPVMTGIGDTARRLIQGTPVGSWLDEAAARLVSVVPARLGGMPYDQAKQIANAISKVSDADSTKVGALPVIGDVTVGGLTKVAGGLASAPLAPVARVFQGGTLLPRVANAAASGAGYGALYGAGEGDGTGERAANALMGLVTGAGIGAAAPVIGAGARNALNYARGPMAAPQNALAPYNRTAVNRLMEVMDMDSMSPADYGREAARLGREGMLADMGENLTMVTEGLAQQPGRARQSIVAAIEPRQEAAGGRIRHALDQNMGPPVNVPATVEATTRQYSAQARPFYQGFHSMQIPQTREIAQVVDQISRAQPGVMNRALRLAVADGVDPQYLTRLRADPMTPITGRQRQEGVRAWSGVELDYIKRAVDDVARSAAPGSNEQRIFGNLARSLRDTVDEAISPGAPAQSVWAQARAIAGDGIGAREAIDAGQRAFNSNLTADQMAATMQGMSALERDGFQVGAREALRRRMDTAATNFRANGDAAARRALNAPENQRKLEQITNPHAARNIIDRVGAENTMAGTAGTVLGNSATARRQAVRDIIPRQYNAASMRELRGSSLSGLITEGVGRIANLVTAGELNARNMRVARDMAEMLVAQGATRDQIAQELFARARQVARTRVQNQNVQRVIELVLRGTTAPAVDAATGQ